MSLSELYYRALLGMKWALKLVIKIMISRLPVPYKFWKTIGVFRHGRMDSADYPLKIFNLHLKRAYPSGIPQQAVILELGPGDSIASAIIATAYGVKSSYLLDVGRYACHNVKFYKNIALELHNMGIGVADISSAESLEDVLQICNAQYLTNGINDIKQIPSNTIDFAWSHSVIEHVRKDELKTMFEELNRILKPGALSSHNIDYQDHLDGSLNNLRFSDKTWESDLFSNSGFYTNRIPAVTMHDLFKSAGFEIVKEAFGKWPELPVSRASIHSEFQSYSDEELLNRTSHILLKA